MHNLRYVSNPESVDAGLLILRRAQGLQFLDKTTLGYSSVFGIIADNHLVGQDYSWCSYAHSVFENDGSGCETDELKQINILLRVPAS